MNIPDELNDVLVSNPEIHSGDVCFKGTRVPVEIFLDYMIDGSSLDEFLRDYGGVQRDQAQRVLDWQGEQSKRLIGLELVS